MSAADSITSAARETAEPSGFTWADHSQRIDARHRVLAAIREVAAMELPQATWDHIGALIETEIEAGRATPDDARDAWRRANRK